MDFNAIKNIFEQYLGFLNALFETFVPDLKTKGLFEALGGLFGSIFAAFAGDATTQG